jgi:hypothetical protein
MKYTIQNIDFSPKYFDLYVSGKITTAVRFGHRNYVPGECVVNGMRSANVYTFLDAVYHCQVKDLTEVDDENDGFHNLDEILEVLYSSYPNIQLFDDITILRFKNFLNTNSGLDRKLIEVSTL